MRYSLFLLCLACRGPQSSHDPKTTDTGPSSTDPSAVDTSTTSWAPLPTEDEAALQAGMELALTETGAPGVALGVATHSDRRRWVSSTGWADVDAQRAWLPDTPYPIGSVTKTYVSVLVLQLMEAGTLTLDDPVEQWVDHPWAGQGVTLRHLLQHRSGIASYNYVGGFDGSQTWTPDELVDWAYLVDPDLHFPAGEGFEYSNTNFILLGLVAEQATGNPLADELDARFFGPLGMTHTSMMTEHPADLVHGYSEGVDITDDFHPTAGWAAGGLVSTPADQLVWGTALFGGELVAPETLELMTTPLLVDGKEVGYGLGLFGGIDGDYGGHWGHTGGYSGQLTYLYHLDSVDHVVVAMVNSFDADLDRVANAAWLEILDLSY